MSETRSETQAAFDDIERMEEHRRQLELAMQQVVTGEARERYRRATAELQAGVDVLSDGVVAAETGRHPIPRVEAGAVAVDEDDPFAAKVVHHRDPSPMRERPADAFGPAATGGGGDVTVPRNTAPYWTFGSIGLFVVGFVGLELFTARMNRPPPPPPPPPPRVIALQPVPPDTQGPAALMTAAVGPAQAPEGTAPVAR